MWIVYCPLDMTNEIPAIKDIQIKQMLTYSIAWQNSLLWFLVVGYCIVIKNFAIVESFDYNMACKNFSIERWPDYVQIQRCNENLSNIILVCVILWYSPLSYNGNIFWPYTLNYIWLPEIQILGEFAGCLECCCY